MGFSISVVGIADDVITENVSLKSSLPSLNDHISLSVLIFINIDTSSFFLCLFTHLSYLMHDI